MEPPPIYNSAPEFPEMLPRLQSLMIEWVSHHPQPFLNWLAMQQQTRPLQADTDAGRMALRSS